jgi:hypothetical protein
LQQNLPEAEIAEQHKHISIEKRMHSFLTPIARQTSSNLGSRGFEIAQMLIYHRDPSFGCPRRWIPGGHQPIAKEPFVAPPV